ncbi:MAG: Rpp14/Pop5 family protein [Candidatus Bathyarchaeia archaeon]
MTRRYLLIKILYDNAPTDQQFHDALNTSVRTHFGDIGFSRIDPRIIKSDQSTSTSVVSCERNAVRELEAALALITECGGTCVAVLVLAVSGTIKGLRKRRVR